MAPDTGLAAVRIPPQSDGWLGFDLAEVMSAVGQCDNLRWVLRWAQFNGDVSAVWPDEIDSVEARTRLPEGIPMTWSQIVDGEFSGYQETRLRLRLEVLDSSYWVVTADDPQVLAIVQSAFNGVTTLDPA